MTKRRLSLFSAAASTVCAIVWLVNCVLDATIGIESPGQAVLHGLCTVVWAACAALWWVRWHKERPASGNAQVS